MAGYIGWAELLDARGTAVDIVQAELWSDPDGSGWSGDLLPARGRSFAPGVSLETSRPLTLRLPSGRTGRCEIERVRNGDPALVRVGGRGAAPFG